MLILNLEEEQKEEAKEHQRVEIICNCVACSDIFQIPLLQPKMIYIHYGMEEKIEDDDSEKDDSGDDEGSSGSGSDSGSGSGSDSGSDGESSENSNHSNHSEDSD